MMFPECVFNDCQIEVYRTTRVNGFFDLSSQIQQFLEQKEKGKSDQNNHFSLSVVRQGIQAGIRHYTKAFAYTCLKPLLKLICNAFRSA